MPLLTIHGIIKVKRNQADISEKRKVKNECLEMECIVRACFLMPRF